MKRKYFLLILFIIFILSGILLLKEYTYYSKEDNGWKGKVGKFLNKTNSFNISYEGFDSTAIDVVWKVEHDEPDTIVKKGIIVSNFGYEYGPQGFEIYYKKGKLYSLRFLSTNRNYQHEVEIQIMKTRKGFHFISIIDSKQYEKEVNDSISF